MATTEAWCWLVALVVLPLAVVAASFTPLQVEKLRVLTVACAAALLATASLVLFAPALGNLDVPFSRPGNDLFGESLLRVSAVSSVLVPLTAAVWLSSVAVTPRARLDRSGLVRTALATLVTLVSVLTVSPLVLCAAWLASTVILVAALSTSPETRHARRVASSYLGGSSLALVLGVALGAWPGARGTWVETAGIWLMVVAVLVRKAIFPFHAWIPELMDRGRIGPTVLFCAPQVGAYVATVLVVPRAPPDVLRVVAVLGLATAVYGALLALVQRDARRACGYLFVSQSALVMAGLDCTSREALAGALVLWISSAVAFAGLARSILVVEARRGRLDLSKHHGGYERMPLLAVSFLVMGLACTGFPGTLGFIGGELLVDGAVDVFPMLGFLVIVAGAITGVAVLRMYFSLFCGARDDAVHLRLLPRERWVFAALAVFLIGTGVAPRALVESRSAAGALVEASRVGTNR